MRTRHKGNDSMRQALLEHTVRYPLFRCKWSQLLCGSGYRDGSQVVCRGASVQALECGSR
jgi:hypothetical protein